MTKLSIIIPVYNAADYLPQTLNSILGQSLKEIEVICVDDGSTDSSRDILHSYAQKDPRVQVLCQENLHAGVARNAGLAVATGEYVHFLDADDYVLNYAYEALYNKAVKYDLDCLKFSSVAYDMQQQSTVELPAYSLDRLRPGDFNRLLTLEEGSPIYRVNVAPWNGIYRRSFLEEKQIRFNSLFCVNDRSFFCKVITNARRMMIARDRLVVHRVNLSTSLVGVRAQHFDCHFRSIELISDQLVQDGIPEDTTLLIMQKEFTDLFVWYKKFSTDELSGEEICRETERFVAEYQGLYPELLASQHFDTLRRLAAGEQPANPPKPLPVEHSRCSSPKVSVVLPIYNVEDYLNEALYSLSVQTLEEMEFICVNDGSTDGSLTIVKEYANLDKRFRILDGPNGGYGKAMNRGIDAARGEYLGILEPDDFVPNDMFKALYKVAKKNDVDFVKADFTRFTVNPDGSLHKRRARLSDDPSYYNRVISPAEEPIVFQFVMNTWAGIYNLNFLNRNHIRHNETPGASYQDNGFWFKTFCCAQRIWFVNKPYYQYRRDNPNASMLSTKKMYCATEEYRLIWEWLEQYPDKLARFAPAYYRKKFVSFMVTYRRIDDSLRQEYLHHICDEFKPPMEAGLLDETLFGPVLWKYVNEILADPDAFLEKIRVSVIIPVYNAEQYLHQCLDSLLAHPEQRIEVICVDDGSTDRSLEILREYEAKYPRVTVLTQENAGAGAARNTGMALAKGEYLSFLDADDFFEPDMLKSAYDHAYADESDIVVFRSDLYSERTGEYTSSRHTIASELLPLTQPFAGQDIPRDIFRAFVGWAWDKLFRTEFIRELGLRFQEQRTTNDMFFVFSAIVKAQRISTSDAVLAHHRRGNGSLSVTREQSWHCFYDALCALRQQLKDWSLFERYEQDFVNYSLHFTLWNITTLRGPAYHLLFDKLKEAWLEDLELTSRDAHYFYDPSEYQQLQTLLSSDSEEFLFCQLDDARAEVAELRKKCSQLQSQVKSQRKEIRSKNRQCQQLKAKNKELKQSTIWKVGRIVTWPLRKLKRLLTKKK